MNLYQVTIWGGNCPLYWRIIKARNPKIARKKFDRVLKRNHGTKKVANEITVELI